MGAYLRPLEAADRGPLEDALRQCGAFHDGEIRVALAMIDQGLSGDYDVLVADHQNVAAGYVCLGQTPLTASTWHLYWICVHPFFQRRGVGRMLQEAAEQHVRRHSGERLVVETSGRPDYAGTRAFYIACGYEMCGRIQDYYKDGDDLILFKKSLMQSEVEP